MSYRITVDVGGTFTDVVVADENASLVVGKAPTDRERAFVGVRGALQGAEAELGRTVDEILRDTDLLVYSTTRSTNAVIEGRMAKTALFTTEGFPDVLVLREGGKTRVFDLDVPPPEPYVPRRLTFQVPERITAHGEIRRPLDEAAVIELIRSLKVRGVEAVAVCLLWSVVNPVHELRIGELLRQEAPDIAFTLSHELLPSTREYRRASTTAIDVSLKPLMRAHLRAVETDLTEAGFRGELLAATSFGGVMHIGDLSERPVYSVKSGPSLAPRAASVLAAPEGASDLVVCDVGGTSFDVSVVRGGDATLTRETWLGPQFRGHLLATPSVDVRSIGAGGGSIAWLDPGGLLRVGPESAGANPGPACYGLGGTQPTVTDAAAALGYLDPDEFLGGRMALDVAASRASLGEIARALNLEEAEVASAILKVANEHMVTAIREITVNEGLDPRECLFVAGGGAAGLGIGRIIDELGSTRVLIPRVAGALSAVGGQFSDIVMEFSGVCGTSTADFDFDAVREVTNGLDDKATEFAKRLSSRGVDDYRLEYFISARYAMQTWELEIALPGREIDSAADVAAVKAAFDREYERVFGFSEPSQGIEISAWKVRLVADVGLRLTEQSRTSDAAGTPPAKIRQAYFDGAGWVDTATYLGRDLVPGHTFAGPAIVIEPTSTVVVYPGMTVTVTDSNNYMLEVLS